MDKTMHQQFQIESQFSKSKLLKQALQFVISVSIFSFLFSNTSWLPSYRYSFNLYFPLHFFNYTIDKNYIFLLCNGILVFLAKSSGLIDLSSFNDDLQDEFANKDYGDHLRSQPEFSEMGYVIEKEVVEVQSNELCYRGGKQPEFSEMGCVIEKEVEVQSNEFFIKDGGYEEGNGLLITDELQEEVGGRESGLWILDEVAEREEEGNGLLSTEELNKKFDEFIKKMKEDIRIEALQELTLV